MESFQRSAISCQLVKGLSELPGFGWMSVNCYVNCQLDVERCPVDGNTHSGYRRMSVNCKLSTVKFVGTAEKMLHVSPQLNRDFIPKSYPSEANCIERREIKS